MQRSVREGSSAPAARTKTFRFGGGVTAERSAAPKVIPPPIADVNRVPAVPLSLRQESEQAHCKRREPEKQGCVPDPRSFGILDPARQAGQPRGGRLGRAEIGGQREEGVELRVVQILVGDHWLPDRFAVEDVAEQFDQRQPIVPRHPLQPGLEGRAGSEPIALLHEDGGDSGAQLRVRPRLHQHLEPHHRPWLAGDRPERAKQRPRLGSIASQRVDGCGDPREALVEVVFDRGDDDVEPALEVMEQGPYRDARTPADLAGRRVAQANQGDRVQCRIDDQVDGLRRALGLGPPAAPIRRRAHPDAFTRTPRELP